MPIGSRRFCQVDRVGRDDHAAAGDLVADQFGVEVLALGDEVHFVGDDALAGGFELRHGSGSPGKRDGRQAGGRREAASRMAIRFPTPV